jgi:hypothetical protein
VDLLFYEFQLPAVGLQLRLEKVVFILFHVVLGDYLLHLDQNFKHFSVLQIDQIPDHHISLLLSVLYLSFCLEKVELLFDVPNLVEIEFLRVSEEMLHSKCQKLLKHPSNRLTPEQEELKKVFLEDTIAEVSLNLYRQLGEYRVNCLDCFCDRKCVRTFEDSVDALHEEGEVEICGDLLVHPLQVFEPKPNHVECVVHRKRVINFRFVVEDCEEDVQQEFIL